MNKNQWVIFGIGFFILSMYMFYMALGWGICSFYDEEIMISCFIRKYAYAIPAIIFLFSGWIFIICSFFEGKKK